MESTDKNTYSKNISPVAQFISTPSGHLCVDSIGRALLFVFKGCEMTAPKELILQGDRYTLSADGRTLDQAEKYCLRLRDDGLFAIVRHYDGKFCVYLRTKKA